MEHEHETEHEHKLNPMDNSPYRVAYDLMKDIVAAEKTELHADNAREYFLNLFSKCRNSVFEGQASEGAAPDPEKAAGHHHVHKV
jgi:hypothetical protein